MQGSLGDEGIVVLFGESACAVEGSCNDTDSLELGTRIADRVFVDGEGLGKEFVAELLEACLVRYFSAHYEQAQG